MAATRVLQTTVVRSDGRAAFVGLSIAHATLLVLVPSAPLIALLMWWNGNTISHNFIHRPFFRSVAANRAYAVFLSVLLGVPQSLWRARHLAHHASECVGRPASPRGVAPWTAAMWIESAAVLSLMAAIALSAPHRLLTVYLPGYLAGGCLCWLQGHYEHAGGVTSHYGRLYNWLFFNDGYHAEHHARPHTRWSDLPSLVQSNARASAWPPVFRWLDAARLDALERLVIASPALRRFVLARHERAFRALLPEVAGASRVTIVGGGLYPRTAIVLGRLLPHATLTIVDLSRDHLEAAKTFLDGRVRLVCRRYEPHDPEDADLVIVPLAFRGDRDAVYRAPNAPLVLVHDWIWRRRGEGVRVSWLLLKRLNLVRVVRPSVPRDSPLR